MKDRVVYDVERNIQFNILTPEMKEKINEGALQILEEIGMKVSGERTLAKFAEKGITPDENGMLHIPRSLVKWAWTAIPACRSTNPTGFISAPTMTWNRSWITKPIKPAPCC